MAIGKYSRMKQIKNENEQSLCRCVVSIFQVVVFCQNISSIAAQGSIPTNVQHNILLQDTSLFVQHEVNGVTDSELLQLDPSQIISSQADVVRFEPPYLDFETQPLGMPESRIVYVINPSKTKFLKLKSISATTAHFHSSFFDKKVLLPNSNTSFEVVFLARAIGNVENTLYINTFVGTFSYQVFGVGVTSPYGLRPYLGAKVSINSSFSPLISMHNPTGTPLQVLEMYTSSGYLHLQLPTGAHEGSKKLWEIPPYETKPLMQASFVGRVADNHTAFIRIKTNHTDITKYLILPMEVEVSSVPGIYSSLEMLDFGTLRTHDNPKVLNLFLLNFGSKEVQISSVVAVPANPAIEIDFKPIKLKPSEALYTRVANVSFIVKRAKREDQWSGKIVIKTKEKTYSKLEISFQANILDGNLGYNETLTYFRIPLDESSSDSFIQNISLTNTFTFPVILHKLQLTDNADNYYKVVNFTSPCTIPPQETVTCFMVECTTSAFRSMCNRVSSSVKVDSTHHVILHTNASTFSMPLHAYTGFLTYKVQKGNAVEMDFGIMVPMDKRQMLLTIYNHNPLPVQLLDCNTTLAGVILNFVSLTKEGREVDALVGSVHQDLFLPPQSCLTVEVVLTSPKSEVDISGSLNVHTPFEKLEIPLKGRVAIGSLSIKPANLKFRPSFPGLVVQQTVSITSSFSQASRVEGLTSLDRRFYYRKHKNVGVDLEPGRELKAGKVYFDARQTCKSDRCYVGLPTSTTVGHHWLTTMNLGMDAADVDSKLYRVHRGLWKDLQENGDTTIDSSFFLNTTLRATHLPVSASLYWPSLFSEPTLQFPLTHVGKKSVLQIILRNPSDVPVIVQILPISIYPQPLSVVRALDLHHLLEDEEFISNNASTFNVSLTPNSSNQDTSSQMVWLEYTLGGKTNRSCVNVFLNPGQKQKVDITFAPFNDQFASTLILARNNLTILDSLLVRGRGVKEELKLGGKLSNQLDQPLRFKLTESLLRDCHVEKRNDKLAPSFTVRKSFTAKNLGLLKLQVLYMMVDSYPCEGYGFRILECEAFVLQPNETKDIIIAFTPDFTSSQITHALRIWTSQGNILTFTLNVTLPHHLLPICQASIPRPSWEQLLYYCFTILVIAMFVGVVFYAYLEAINIVEPHIRNYELESQLEVKPGKEDKSPPGKGRPFNLQEVATTYNQNALKPSDSSIKRFKTNSNTSSLKIWKFLSNFQFGLHNIFTHLRWRRSSKQKLETESSSTEEDPESLSSHSKSDVEVTKSVLQNTSTVSSARSRRKQPKKSKPVHTGLWQRDHTVKANKDNNSKSPTVEYVDIPWSRQRTGSSKSPEKIVESRKISADSSCASSLDSSRSRGSSSSSSALNESDRGKVNLNSNDVVKRKRKNKPNRHTAYLHDHDDTSSTTTEKSSEDFDEKQTSFNDSSAKKEDNNKTKRNSIKSSPSKHKNPDSEYRQQNISLPYSMANEQNLRRRHARSCTLPLTGVKETTPSKSKPIKKLPSFPSTYYDTTSSTDEPVWSKSKTPKRDVDEHMLNLAEQTRQADFNIRPKTQRNKQKLPPNKSSSYSSVVSSSNEAINKKPAATKSSPVSPPKKHSLLKAKSMPEDITGRGSPKSPIGTESSACSRRHSNNESNNGFSVFASTSSGCQPGFAALSESNNLPAWNNFGQNSFSLTEGLLPYATMDQPNPPNSPVHSTPQWGTYSPVFRTPQTSRWSPQDNVLNLNVASSPDSPTSPCIPLPSSESPVWGSSPSPPSRSTHAIWSVSNAVTMDEDRNAAENDPLGLKSIWNSGEEEETQQSGEWF